MKARKKPVGISVAEKLGWAAALVVALAGGGYVLTRPRGVTLPGMPSSAGTAPVRSEVPYQPRPRGSLTFHKDVAPIIHSRCAPCHHAGQPAPFDLLTYRDVAKRAPQVLELVQRNYMPPWLPEPGFGNFAEERRLTAEQKGILQQWVEEGAMEGVSTPATRAPVFEGGWTLGRPDLVVTLPESYELGADGPDLYRNFVVPVAMGEDRYVRAVEFAPGNTRVVHHAFIKVDAKRASRLMDARDAEPGFPGLTVPAEMPNGQFLTWQPGKQPSVAPEGLSWKLPGPCDLVLQLHLKRTGKPESVRPSIGLYFTNAPPTRIAAKMVLSSIALDFPPGASNQVVTDSFTLPVDAEAIAVLPHAHYLAREMQSYATLPDGSRRWLLLIKEWDFKWQGDYRYAEPVPLPKGSTVHLRFTYDNSTNNLRNPNTPPQRVKYGPQTADEMCEVWLQLLPRSRDELATLNTALEGHSREIMRVAAERRVAVDPGDAPAHVELGVLAFMEGRSAEALERFRRATEINPGLDQPHYYTGMIFRSQQRLPDARRELEAAVRLNPQNASAFGHLGFVLAAQGDGVNAERAFVRALSLDPGDTLVRESLEELRHVIRSRR